MVKLLLLKLFHDVIALPLDNDELFVPSILFASCHNTTLFPKDVIGRFILGGGEFTYNSVPSYNTIVLLPLLSNKSLSNLK